MVHDIELFSDISDVRLSYLEFPKAKCSWLLRCYYEYIFFNGLSKKINPDVWLSIHDTTPHVTAGSQFVYCHTSSPFYRMRVSEILDDWKFTLFVLFYRWLYRINILSNRYVIVQQDWMRRGFEELYGLSNIIVARPEAMKCAITSKHPVKKGYLLYPVTSHTYKNIEILAEAAKFLTHATPLQIICTIDGTEDKYSKRIVEKYGNIPVLQFIGRQTRERIFELYSECEALLFPSRLESWGMPLSEFMETGKPIIVSDLPYAHEVLDGYKKVKFVDPLDAMAWKRAIYELLVGKLSYDCLPRWEPPAPYAKNWQELFSLLKI